MKLFSEDEIHDLVFDLNDEIDDLLSDGYSASSPIVKRREDKINSLNNQKLSFENGKKHINLKDMTFVSDELSGIIFIQSRFNNGHFLGFWSHSPWGTCNDQETGWVVFNPHTFEIIDQCETKHNGEYREWRRDIKNKFGGAKTIKDMSGETLWKMSET